MDKVLFLSLFLCLCLSANPLVDALKGKPTSSKTSQQGLSPNLTDVKSKKVCDNALIDAVDTSDKSFFETKKGSLKELNNCLIAGELTPLMAASYMDKPYVVKLFLEEGVYANEQNDKGNFALYYAALFGNYIIANMLLDFGADINMQNSTGQTALMAAAYYGNTKTVTIFLKRGADYMIRDQAGNNAQDIAKIKNKKDIVKLLSN